MTHDYICPFFWYPAFEILLKIVAACLVNSAGSHSCTLISILRFFQGGRTQMIRKAPTYFGVAVSDTTMPNKVHMHAQKRKKRSLKFTFE